MARDYDWPVIKARYEMGQTAYQIAQGPGMPTKQGIAKRAEREGWIKPEGSNRLPIVAEAFHIDSSKLTDDVLHTVLGLMAEGATQELACSAAGISPRTWQMWQKDDPKLKDMAIRARSGTVIGYLNNVHKASEKDWKAATWMLQNSPDTRKTFGQQQHDNKLEVVINIDRHTDNVTIDGQSQPESVQQAE